MLQTKPPRKKLKNSLSEAFSQTIKRIFKAGRDRRFISGFPVFGFGVGFDIGHGEIKSGGKARNNNDRYYTLLHLPVTDHCFT